ncbi:MAG: hypothetical protein R3175_17015 [Marinobacter sp.]|uniref:hypothetical protein n=1 Tax=Marinobacter sp. TaxID=50741 RepID=UPI00299CFC04|nr:hypothetical protein [Marinobacter sp.]MDX1757760.1 hypothetical protein [Marinobacter sp.]
MDELRKRILDSNILHAEMLALGVMGRPKIVSFLENGDIYDALPRHLELAKTLWNMSGMALFNEVEVKNIIKGEQAAGTAKSLSLLGEVLIESPLNDIEFSENEVDEFYRHLKKGLLFIMTFRWRCGF